MLYPTSPFRKSTHIDELINKVILSKAASGQTISVLKRRIGTYTNGWYKYNDNSKVLNMKLVEKLYIENSGAYIFKPKVLLETGRMQSENNIGSILEFPYDLDINCITDYQQRA